MKKWQRRSGKSGKVAQWQGRSRKEVRKCGSEDVGKRLAIADEFVDGQIDVLRYLSKQDGGNVSARVKRNCCGTPVGMAK